MRTNKILSIKIYAKHPEKNDKADMHYIADTWSTNFLDLNDNGPKN